jgi:methylmalonyl-CoA mutase, N-terminal domain
VLPPLRDALALRATGGEIAHALRAVWGVYQPQETL